MQSKYYKSIQIINNKYYQKIKKIKSCKIILKNLKTSLNLYKLI